MGFTTGGSGFTGGSSSSSDKEGNFNLKKTLLSALNRPSQAAMQGLHPFSGTKGKITPDVILQGLKGFGHGLTDISGEDDINAFQMENLDKPNTRIANLADVAAQIALDPTNLIGGGTKAIGKGGLEAIRAADKGLAEIIARKGVNGLDDASRAKVTDILKSSEAAGKYKKGADAYVQAITGKGSGVKQTLGALSEAPGIKVGGKTVLTNARISESVLGRGAKALGNTQVGQALSKIGDVRAPIGRVFGKAAQESVRQAQGEAEALKSQIIADAVNKLQTFENKIPKAVLDQATQAMEKGTTKALAAKLLAAGDHTSAEFVSALDEVASQAHDVKNQIGKDITSKAVQLNLPGKLEEAAKHVPGQEILGGIQPSLFGHEAPNLVRDAFRTPDRTFSVLRQGADTVKDIAGRAGTAEAQGRLFGSPIHSIIHILTPRAEKYLQENPVNLDKALPAGATLVEKNQILKNLTGQNFDFYDTNPVNNVLRSVVQTAADAGKQKLVEHLSNIKDTEGNRLAQIAQKSGYEVIHTPNGPFYAPPVVKQYLKDLTAKFDSPEEMKQLGSLLDGFDKTWKAGATSALFLNGIPFQMHNIVGNMINMWTKGFYNPKFFGQAKNLRDVVVKASKEGTPVKTAIANSSLTDTQKELLTKALDKGVISDGYFRSEFGIPKIDVEAKPLYKNGRKIAANITGTKQGKQLASFFEDNMRLAMFLHGVDETGSFAKAEELVKDTLFNYQDLSPSMRQTKKLVPFLTWQKNNIPFQLKALANVPGKVKGVEKFQAALLQDPNADDSWQEDMPPWAKQGNMQLLGSWKGSPLYGTFPTPFTSFTDTAGGLANIAAGHPEQGAQALVGNLGGARGSLLKQGIAEATGTDPFTGMPLRQSTTSLGNPLDPKQRDALQRLIFALNPGAGRVVGPAAAVQGGKPGKQASTLLKQLGLNTTYSS